MKLIPSGKAIPIAALALAAPLALGLIFNSIVKAGDNDKGGAELWANNCRQCHNYRRPASYSSDQWDVAVNHMRYRCGLTAKEARKIAEFLKSAH